MSSALFFLYEFLLAPVAWFLFQAGRLFGDEKWKLFVAEKNARTFHRGDRPLTADEESKIREGRPIWIHAASGEIEYARPVLRRLKAEFPGVPLIVTYTSPSARRILRDLPEPDAWGPLPWEFRSHWGTFFWRWTPRLALFARTDVWPLAARETARRRVPAALFSATFATDSSRLRGPALWMTRRTLSFLSRVAVVSLEDLDVLHARGLTGDFHAEGDTRFDQVFHRLAHPKPLHARLRPPPGADVLVAGSTWPEDDRVLLEALPQFPALRVLWAPHEIGDERLRGLEAKITAAGRRCVRYSEAREWNEGEILLLDQIGVLAELYTWGRVAFVGGSFRRQVHSVMEPLAAGNSVLVGPYHLNNREALDFQKIVVHGEKLVTVTANSIAFTQALERKLSWSKDAAIADVQDAVRSRAGATEKLIEWLRPLV